MVPLCSLIQAIPISFNGWGIREGVYVLYFHQVGLPARKRSRLLDRGRRARGAPLHLRALRVAREEIARATTPRPNQLDAGSQAERRRRSLLLLDLVTRDPAFVRGGALAPGDIPVFTFHSLEPRAFERKMRYLQRRRVSGHRPAGIPRRALRSRARRRRSPCSSPSMTDAPPPGRWATRFSRGWG